MSAAWIAAFLALWVVVILETVLVLGLMRRVWHLAQEAQLLITGPGFDLAVGGAPAGAAIPAFHVTDAEGRPLSSADLFAMPAVALFVERGCGPCRELARELSSLATAPSTACHC